MQGIHCCSCIDDDILSTPEWLTDNCLGATATQVRAKACESSCRVLDDSVGVGGGGGDGGSGGSGV